MIGCASGNADRFVIRRPFYNTKFLISGTVDILSPVFVDVIDIISMKENLNFRAHPQLQLNARV